MTHQDDPHRHVAEQQARDGSQDMQVSNTRDMPRVIGITTNALPDVPGDMVPGTGAAGAAPEGMQHGTRAHPHAPARQGEHTTPPNVDDQNHSPHCNIAAHLLSATRPANTAESQQRLQGPPQHPMQHPTQDRKHAAMRRLQADLRRQHDHSAMTPAAATRDLHAAVESQAPESSPRSGVTLLVEARQRARLTQRALAERARVSFSMIGQIEMGRRRPSRAFLRQLAPALGLDHQELHALIAAFGLAPVPDTNETVENIAAFLRADRRLGPKQRERLVTLLQKAYAREVARSTGAPLPPAPERQPVMPAASGSASTGPATSPVEPRARFEENGEGSD